MHIFHSPHKLVDQFSSLGIQGTWCNTKRNQDDLRYIIPAEITFEGKSHRGLITYAIDRNTNICYHRFFTEKKDRDLVYQIINKTFDENDFPELKDVVNSPPPSKPKYLAEYKCTVAIDDRTGNVEIQDHDRGVLIKLFKTS